MPGPRLPRGFERAFTSRYAKTGDLRQHVVIGGDGPPLLLVHGWPENWYAWRLVMQLAGDLVALMDALGHERFAVVGHDTGMVIAYALAADHPGRVARLVVIDAPLPGVA